MTDAIIMTQEDFFNKMYVPLTLLQGFEKGYSRFACERELETEHKLEYFDPHTYGRQRCVFLVLLMLNRSPFFLHFINIFSGPQFIRASRGPLRPGVAFLTTPRLQLRRIFNSTGSWTQLALYNRSTPTRSLKSNV